MDVAELHVVVVQLLFEIDRFGLEFIQRQGVLGQLGLQGFELVRQLLVDVRYLKKQVFVVFLNKLLQILLLGFCNF